MLIIHEPHKLCSLSCLHTVSELRKGDSQTLLGDPVHLHRALPTPPIPNICLSLTLIPLSSLDPTCQLLPAWFFWSLLGSGNGRSGWERLAKEGKGLQRLRRFSGTPTSFPPKSPEDPQVSGKSPQL